MPPDAEKSPASAGGLASSSGIVEKENGGGWNPRRSARIHDDMNMVVLFIMSVAASTTLYLGDVELQYKLTVFASSYMALDAVWLMMNMDSVKSAKAILGHHVATLIVLCDPLYHPRHGTYTAFALLVEYNTLLLILRRRVSWGSRWLVEIPFIVSWVGLRLIWYPFLAYLMLLSAFPNLEEHFPLRVADWHRTVEGDTPQSMFLISYIAWLGICIFQGWWSMALFKTYSRRIQSPQTNSAKQDKYL